MANIFSGVLGGGSVSPSDRIKYQQQMDEYELKRAAYQRRQDIAASEAEYQESIKDMTPERQSQADYFRKMLGLQSMGDEGAEGLNRTLAQRGTTISDLVKSEDDLEKDKEFWDYKQRNPQPGSPNKQVETAKQFIKWWRASPENDQSLTDAEIAQRAWRQEQFLNQGTNFVSTVTGDEVAIKLMEKGITETRAPIISNNLTTFYNDMDDTEFTLAATHRQRVRMKELFDLTNTGTTGWGALLSWFPGSDAKEWDAKKVEILSNVGLDKILDLKAGSAQGATGLGALNEKELEMLQTYLSRIEQSRNPQGLKKSIESMDRWMGRLMNKRQRSAILRRRQYNEHKYAIGKGGKNTPDEIPEHQESMFSTEPWAPVKMESSFGADSLDAVPPVVLEGDDLVNRWLTPEAN